ncbi:hypothetical protein K8T06_09455, partial [bacterium]|nr:hypothetical protein [bacterium]
SYFISEYPFAHGTRQEVCNRYSAQFGEKPDAFSMRTYEAVYLVISAVESGVRFRPQLKHWLMSNTGVKGLDGQAWFNLDGNYEPSMTVYRIHGKKYLPWRTILPKRPVDPPPNQDLQDSAQSQE